MNQLIERALLVGLKLDEDPDFEDSFLELKQLANANAIEVVGFVFQQAKSIIPNYYIGSGKVNDVKNEYDRTGANLIIFNDELSPVHIRNLEKELDAKIIDRTLLILDIFAKRARTQEAMLQVSLAQAQYMLPRIIGLHESLSRQKSGTGSKGPGEKQLELDKRMIKNDISRIKSELQTLVEQRRVQRLKRNKKETYTVAIVGYTNAGKSSLMNALLSRSLSQSEKTVFVKDMLFATLETSTRRITIPPRRELLLTDTVGFISRLPHQLVEAFKSTLEEIVEADLILHLVDSANPKHDKNIEVVNKVLEEIGAAKIPQLLVWNKIDLLPDPLVIPNSGLSLSVKNGVGFDILLSELSRRMDSNYIKKTLTVPYQESELRAKLHSVGAVLNVTDTGDAEIIEVELPIVFASIFD